MFINTWYSYRHTAPIEKERHIAPVKTEEVLISTSPVPETFEIFLYAI